MLGDPGEAINARNQGFGVRSFVQTVARYASHIVVKADVLAKAGVAEVSDVGAKAAALRGLRMGTTGPGAAPDNLLRWMAKRGGMDSNKDMRLVPVQGGGPGMVAGLQQGVIDGFCLSSPTADLAVSRAGCAYLFDMAANPPPEFSPFLYIGASTSERAIGAKREALVRYAHGIALALRAMRADPERFRAFAVGWLELDPAIVERAFASNGRIYFESPVPDDALFRRNIAFLNVSRTAQGEEALPEDLAFTSFVRHEHCGRGRAAPVRGISIQGVGKAYVSRGAERRALERVDLEIGAGEFVAFVGPSGCGKSTLMNMIAGLLPIGEGRIVHDGRRGGGREPARGLHDAGRRGAALAHGAGETWSCRYGCTECRTRRPAPRRCWRRWGWRGSPTPTRPSSRAACASGSRWRSCWPTSPARC